MEENSLKLHEAASPLVQEWPTYLLQEEVVKESVFSASSSIPSSKSLESEQKFCEGLSSATPKGLEPDLQFTTSTPAQPGQPALAFTDESSSSQQSFEKNWNTMSQDLEHNEKNFKTDQGFYNLGQDHIKKIQEPAKSEANLKIEDDIIPAVVVTQPEEVSSDQEEDTLLSEKLEDIMVCHASHAVSRSDGPELNNSDLRSLKSDTASLISETAISGKSDDQEGPEDDTQSVTASSVMSLFHRLQMDPVEREWLRCAALGNVSVLHLLLQQEPSLISKKDFVTTALHWAAKQGRMEMVDMMARSGADVNQRAGYTALHLASLHGHDHIIQLLINNYNAKVNIRDYHGKMAAHYWNGNMDIFNKHGSHSAGRWSRGRRAQCYSQLSSLLSRSRSQGNISVEISQLELMPMNRSPSS